MQTWGTCINYLNFKDQIKNQHQLLHSTFKLETKLETGADLRG